MIFKHLAESEVQPSLKHHSISCGVEVLSVFVFVHRDFQPRREPGAEIYDCFLTDQIGCWDQPTDMGTVKQSRSASRQRWPSQQPYKSSTCKRSLRASSRYRFYIPRLPSPALATRPPTGPHSSKTINKSVRRQIRFSTQKHNRLKPDRRM